MTTAHTAAGLRRRTEDLERENAALRQTLIQAKELSAVLVEAVAGAAKAELARRLLATYRLPHMGDLAASGAR